MGNTLNKFYGDACNIYNYTTAVTGLECNSASMSDTWILSIKNGTYYNDVLLQRIFMKWFISPLSLPNENTKSLAYEVRVYRDIISPILENHICPNFIEYLGSADNCHFSDIVKIGSPSVNENQIRRSIHFMLNDLPDRPAVTDAEDLNAYTDDVSNLRFSILLNEVVKLGTITMTEYIDETMGASYSLGFTKTSSSFNVADYLADYQLLFQIIVACYVMSLARMNHNDLHFGNVFCEPFDMPHTITYEIEGVLYELPNQQYLAKIYDYDLSYVTLFGSNEKLVNMDPFFRSGRNIFCAQKDLISVLATFFRRRVSETLYFSLFLKDAAAMHDKWSDFLFNDDTTFTDEDVKNDLLTPFQILQKVGELTQSRSDAQIRGGPFYDASSVYSISHTAFSAAGALLSPNLALQRSHAKLLTELEECRRKLGESSADTHSKKRKKI